MAGSPFLRVRGVNKRFGSFTALKDISLDVNKGEFGCFLGPSGCGKTTSLRLIAGFDQPTAGDVQIAGSSMVGVPAYQQFTRDSPGLLAKADWKYIDRNVGANRIVVRPRAAGKNDDRASSRD